MVENTQPAVRTILVIDDQPAVCYSISRLLETEGYRVLVANSGEDGLGLLVDTPVDLVIMDVRMPEMDGLEALQRIKSLQPDLQIIMMTAFSTTEKAIEAMRFGAYDYIAKPFENDELLLRIGEALKSRDAMSKVVRFDGDDSPITSDRVIGGSQAMLDIFKQIGSAAPTDAGILLKGESGSGKDLIARAIYHYSRRAHKPFLAINCSAIPEQLLESELFGYERGAFSGAEFRRIGKFEQCNGGTILLDEIGDMPLSLQSKVLRVLQDGIIQRLGGNESIATDVRILAATNKDIEKMVEQGLFREDLFYRINVVTITIPPLRERREDVKDLVSYFIRKYNLKMGKSIQGITSDLLTTLETHPWPGNVRELENFIQKAMVFCKADYLSNNCFDMTALQRNSHSSIEDAVRQLVAQIFRAGSHENFQTVVTTLEQEIIRRALELSKGNQVHAARMLGISRTTLRKKIGLS